MNKYSYTSVLDPETRLARVKYLCSLLHNPQNSFQSVHIAGTSGKTSVAKFIQRLLSEHGYLVGSLESPVIHSTEEYIRLDGTPISSDNLELIFDKIDQVIPDIVKKYGEAPTFFEIIPVAAFLYFFEKKVDFAVIEVGIGGLLDSTNVISRKDKFSVITQIGYDHQSILGNTIEEIIHQKVGIIPRGGQVVIQEQQDHLANIYLEECINKRTSHRVVDAEIVNTESQICMIKDDHIGPINYISDLYRLNVQTALSCFYLITKSHQKEYDSQKIVRACSGVSFEGRFEVIKNTDKIWIFDGAHNVQKVQGVIESVQGNFKQMQPEELQIICGFSEGKDSNEMVRILSRSSQRTILAFEFDHPFKRSLPFGTDLGPDVVWQTIEQIEQVISSPGVRYILVIGSFYIIYPMKRYFLSG